MTELSDTPTSETLWVVVRDRPPTKTGRFRKGLLHRYGTPGVWYVKGLYWFDARQQLSRYWNVAPGELIIVSAARTTLTKKELKEFEEAYERYCPSKSED